MTFPPVVVSATDGPMPQTVEQMKALKAQGATSVDVQLINTNLVDDQELLELVELEVRNIAEENGLTVNAITRDNSLYGG
jgi:elongation factor Tu